MLRAECCRQPVDKVVRAQFAFRVESGRRKNHTIGADLYKELASQQLYSARTQEFRVDWCGREDLLIRLIGSEGSVALVLRLASRMCKLGVALIKRWNSRRANVYSDGRGDGRDDWKRESPKVREVVGGGREEGDLKVRPKCLGVVGVFGIRAAELAVASSGQIGRPGLARQLSSLVINFTRLVQSDYGALALPLINRVAATSIDLA